MSISIIQTMVLTQITQIRSFLNLVWKPSRTTLNHQAMFLNHQTSAGHIYTVVSSGELTFDPITQFPQKSQSVGGKAIKMRGVSFYVFDKMAF